MKIKIKQKKQCVILLGYGLALGMNIMVVWLFFSAYTTNYYATISINKFNEAHFEVFFVPIAFVVSLIGFYYYIKGLSLEKHVS